MYPIVWRTLFGMNGITKVFPQRINCMQNANSYQLRQGKYTLEAFVCAMTLQQDIGSAQILHICMETYPCQFIKKIPYIWWVFRLGGR